MPNPAPVSGNVVFTGKSGTVEFRILALPTITGVSNANAHAGDSVYVYGTYLKGIQTLSFAGADITAYASADDGSAVGFVMPSVSQDGPVAVTTSFGAATTVYHVNTVASGSTTGVLANMEWGDFLAGPGGEALASSAEIPIQDGLLTMPILKAYWVQIPACLQPIIPGRCKAVTERRVTANIIFL
ncbi:hypothetical protein KRR40_38535 [Niabella defluvii]|nr:hypothetical protein KRR40_38535 [Niabella sp. I65]